MYQSRDKRVSASEKMTDPLPKGYIFNLLVFLIFIFPNWDLASFKLGPVITNLREVCLVMLPVVYFFLYQNRNRAVLKIGTKYWIIVFFAMLVGTELIKKVYFGISFFDSIKNIRIAVPVFSGFLICLQGKKVDPEFSLKTIAVSLMVSCLVTPILVISGIEPASFSLDNRQFQVEYLDQGRILNNNYQFGLIGLALLFKLPKIYPLKTGLKKILLIASGLSLVIMVLYFNRTFLGAAFLLGSVLFLINFNLKTIAYIFTTLIIIGAIGGYFYQTNEEVRNQVENRILAVFQEDSGLAESVYYDNRDKLYAEYIKKAEENWLLGLPGGEVLIDMGDELMSSKSDISIFNIYIRYGLIAVLLYLIVWISIIHDQIERLKHFPKNSLSYQIGHSVLLTVPFYFLVSLNVDVLVAHNGVLYLILFFTFFDVENFKSKYNKAL